MVRAAIVLMPLLLFITAQAFLVFRWAADLEREHALLKAEVGIIRQKNAEQDARIDRMDERGTQALRVVEDRQKQIARQVDAVIQLLNPHRPPP